MRRRQIQQKRSIEEQKEAFEGWPLPKLKATLKEKQIEVGNLARQISSISAAAACIMDPRIESFSAGQWRCRHCNEEQQPKGLASHERWCPSNPNRGKAR